MPSRFSEDERRQNMLSVFVLRSSVGTSLGRGVRCQKPFELGSFCFLMIQ